MRAPGGLRKLCRELLERVNLSFAARRKVKTYSGGMRQRLGIAQAIAGNPRLIIVDEPTAGLDPEERLRFYRLLSELAADRIVLLSTHIVEDVAVLCTRFAVIRQGRLIAYTTPSEATRAIEGTIYEGSISAETYDRLLADPDRRVTQAYLVEGRNRVRVYQPEGSPPDHFEPVTPSLEDAYLVLIKTGGLEWARCPAGLAAECGASDGQRFRRPTRPLPIEETDERNCRCKLCGGSERCLRSDLGSYARRPLFWIWALILALTAWGMSTGQMRIQSGDATVGGTKALISRPSSPWPCSLQS